jgi:geranylgeranyl diphosphate synthase type II
MSPSYLQAKALFEDYLESSLSLQQDSSLLSLPGFTDLQASVRYSLLQTGKRFRPVLCMLLCEEFGVPPQRALPLSAALEMIHTYSLIHDDLPCMDDDDVRRGQPTNHKKFGEALALLAGDALQAEAFGWIARGYPQDSGVVAKLVLLLAEAAGSLGMVGGQAIDMGLDGQVLDLQKMRVMHAMKTGALIRLACEGAGVVMGLPAEKQKTLRQFGENLGLAFQIADDLLDSTEEKIEAGSYPALLGLAASRQALCEVTQESLAHLQSLGLTRGSVYDLVKYNEQRLL